MRHFGRALRDYAEFRQVFKSTPARHKEPSIIVSLDDELAPPTKRLLDVALGAVDRAHSVEFRTLARRTSAEGRLHEVWPGEHYRLLAGLVAELGARNVIEIGTSTGVGCGNSRDRGGAAPERRRHYLRDRALAPISENPAHGG
jgi:hypothetical protein